MSRSQLNCGGRARGDPSVEVQAVSLCFEVKAFFPSASQASPQSQKADSRVHGPELLFQLKTGSVSATLCPAWAHGLTSSGYFPGRVVSAPQHPPPFVSHRHCGEKVEMRQPQRPPETVTGPPDSGLDDSEVTSGGRGRQAPSSLSTALVFRAKPLKLLASPSQGRTPLPLLNNVRSVYPVSPFQSRVKLDAVQVIICRGSRL